MARSLVPTARRREFGNSPRTWWLCLFLALPAFAQYTANNQTNTITVSSNWVDTAGYVVGSNFVQDALLIQSGGVLSNGIGHIGYTTSSRSNLVSVTDAIWSNQSILTVGFGGLSHRLIITNSGKVLSTGATVGNGSNCFILLSDAGSTWDHSGAFNLNGANNQILISNAATMISQSAATMGGGAISAGNIVRVTGTNSAWIINNNLVVGQNGNNHQLIVENAAQLIATNGLGVIIGNGVGNNHSILINGGKLQAAGPLTVAANGGGTLTVTNGGTAIATSARLGSPATGTVVVANGGHLVITNGPPLDVRRGSVNLNGGTLTTDSLILTSLPPCQLIFNGGVVHTKATTVTNGAPFFVGDGIGPGNLHLLGGTHAFNNTLQIRSNSVLTGCGTINSTVRVDPGATINADCGTNLRITGTLTNSGTITATAGTVIDFTAPVVNNGLIDATAGGVHFFSTLINNGTILGVGITNSWLGGNGKWETAAKWSLGTAPATNDTANLITNAGIATITIDEATTNTPGVMTINDLTLTAANPGTNTLALVNTGLAIPFRIRNHLTINSGTLASLAELRLTNSTLLIEGAGFTLNGRLNMDDGLLIATNGELVIGELGNLPPPPSLRFRGGTAILGNVIMGKFDPSIGELVTLGGTQTVDKLLIGAAQDSFCRVIVDGGSLYVTNAAHNAVTDIRHGELVLTNGLYYTDALIATNPVAQFRNINGDFRITGPAHFEQGTQTMLGGSMLLSSNTWFGSQPGQTSLVFMSGGVLTATNGFFSIGNNGSLGNTGGHARVFMSGGTLRAGSLLVGDSSTNGESGLTISTNATVIVTGGAGLNGRRTTVIDGGTLTVLPGAPAFEDPNLHNRIAIAYQGDGRCLFSNGTIRAPEMIVGLAGGTGTLEMNAGTMNLTSNLLVGYTATATGTVFIGGGNITITNGTLGVGNAGTLTAPGGLGLVAMTNGTLQVTTLLVGDNTDDDSSFALSGNAQLIIGGGAGLNGRRTTLINGGTLTILPGAPTYEDSALHNRLAVAYQGDGRLLQSNGTVHAPEMVIGLAAGRGTFEMSGGAMNLSSNLLLGINASATGIVYITGGTLNVTNGICGVGNNGTLTGAGGHGKLTISNGQLRVTQLLVGDTSDDESGFTLAGTGQVTIGGGAGLNGRRTTLVNGGTFEVIAGPVVPFEDPIFHDRIVVGYLTNGRLLVSNGVVRTPGLIVGASPGNAGTLNIAGGTVHVSSNLIVGYTACTATGLVNLTGGTLTITNAAATAELEIRSGTFTLTAGLLAADRLVITNPCAHFLHTGGTLMTDTIVLTPGLDADADGIPNGFDLDPFNPADAGTDTDGDGFSNLQEFQAGTNPTNGTSYFAITSIVKTGLDIRVTWPTTAGRTNALERSLTPGTGFGEIFSITNTILGTTNYTDTGAATNVPAFFYRLRLVP